MEITSLSSLPLKSQLFFFWGVGKHEIIRFASHSVGDRMDLTCAVADASVGESSAAFGNLERNGRTKGKKGRLRRATV